MSYYILFFITLASVFKLITIIPLFFADLLSLGLTQASVDAYNAGRDVYIQWDDIRKELFNAKAHK